MQVTVKFAGPMRALARRTQESVILPGGSRMRDLLDALASILPTEFVQDVVRPIQTGTAPATLVLINTVNLSGPSGLDRPLSDGDLIAFVPPMSGG